MLGLVEKMIEENKFDYDVYFAALLHDIGKYYQKGLSEEICGKKRHEVLGERMLKELHFKDKYEFLRFYYEKDTPEAICVELGDWISAHEREDLEKYEHNNPRETPLLSVFSNLNICQNGQNDSGNEIKYYHLAKPLSVTTMAVDDDYVTSKKITFSSDDYNKFMKGLIKIDEKYGHDVKYRKVLFRAILDLMRKYLYFISSASYYSEPDIDLYTHSKITCAITACLLHYSRVSKNNLKQIYDLKNELKEEFKEKNQSKIIDYTKYDVMNKPLFLLLKGNFSGIQNFISCLSTTKATALLKARSAYLAYLNKLVPQTIINELNLPETNIIYSNGGNFEVLLPNSETVINIITKINKKINQKLYEYFGLGIFIEMKYYQLPTTAFSKGGISKFVSDENKQMSIKITNKNKKYDGILGSKLQIKNSSPFQCHICFNESEQLGEYDECNSCLKLINFRKMIKENKIKTDLFFGMKFNYESSLDEDVYCNLNLISGIYELYPVGIPVRDDNKIIEFDEIADIVEKRTGKRKLAALKIDIDNLGKIFRDGLKEGNKTFSSYSRLSSDISLFFEGYVETLRKKEIYENEIYIIYSGGDDSFIIGSWDKVLDFAKDLLNYFRIYTHNKISFSAGYVMFSPRFPVKKIIVYAEKELKKSKNAGKNRISLLGVPIKWKEFENFDNLEFNLCTGDKKEIKYGEIETMLNSEDVMNMSFELVYKLSIYFIKLYRENIISRNFFTRVVMIGMSAEKNINALNNLDSISGLWQLHYYLTRIKKEENEIAINNLLKIINKIYDLQFNDHKNTIKLLIIASKFAEFNTKENGVDEI